MLTDEYRYKILKMVESNPAISQRELASQLGISLGKANFCLKALIDVGLLKVTNFHHIEGDVRHMKKIVGKIFLDDITLIATANYKVVNPMR